MLSHTFWCVHTPNIHYALKHILYLPFYPTFSLSFVCIHMGTFDIPYLILPFLILVSISNEALIYKKIQVYNSKYVVFNLSFSFLFFNSLIFTVFLGNLKSSAVSATVVIKVFTLQPPSIFQVIFCKIVFRTMVSVSPVNFKLAIPLTRIYPYQSKLGN